MKLADLSQQTQVTTPPPGARPQDPRGAWLKELERAHLLDWFGSRVAPQSATQVRWDAPRAAAPEAGVPPDARGMVAPGQEWPARSVHLMMEASGAQVWIRDSGLTQGSTPRILSSLAGELAQRGLRLRGLTVNGRSAFEWEPATGSETTISRSTFPEEVNRHGDY